VGLGFEDCSRQRQRTRRESADRRQPVALLF